MALYTAFLDACVLVPIAPCDTLLRMASRGAFRPLWSERVTDEALRALHRMHPAIDQSRFRNRFHQMNESFDDASVTGWEPLVDGITLPDPDDRHVVAAALRGRADAIITDNVRDFPASILEPLGLEAITLDNFLLDQLDLNATASCKIIEQQAENMANPPVSVPELLTHLSRSGAPRFAKALQKHLDNAPSGLL